ncbi:sensor histidine kinase [Streptacidiphilus sp. PAMC 29251]
MAGRRRRRGRVTAHGLRQTGRGGRSSTPVRVGTQVWILALGVGLGLRFLDYRARQTAAAVRQDERLALARELHDVVAHHITGIVLQAQGAQIVARSRPETLGGTLTGIEEAGSEALAAMRQVVGLLRDTDDVATTSPTAPGPEQLSELVRRFEGHGPVVRLRLPDEQASWPPEVTSTVYRIVQESLTNIARHASQARSATVDIAQGPAGVTVTITDDAPPGHTRSQHLQKGGLGLIGMRERVEALGGTLTVGPLPGTGWSVLATVPVAAGEAR